MTYRNLLRIFEEKLRDMKIKTINGFKYSTQSFDDYELRLKVRLSTVSEDHQLDIYTTNLDKVEIENTLLDIRSDKVLSLDIFHWATKEQDDMASKFIDETLNLI